MKKTVRIICILSIFSLLVSVLIGCNKRKEGYPPVWTSEDRVVMTLGGYNVAYDFYRYLFLNTKVYFDTSDNKSLNESGTDVEKIKDYVLESLKKTYGMFILADKYNVELSEADLLEIKSTIEEERKDYTDEEFEQSLNQSFLTKELYEFLLKVQYLEYKVYSHIISESSNILMVDDATLQKELETNFARASHILFKFSDEAQKQSQKELAVQVLERLKNGEDFETLKEEYSDDTDLKGNTDGYYFTHGEFNNMFEYTAFDLEVGELSDIVTTDVGFHIIKRLPIEEQYVNKNFEKLRKQCLTAKYYQMLKDTYNELTPEYKKDYKNIKLDTFD